MFNNLDKKILGGLLSFILMMSFSCAHQEQSSMTKEQSFWQEVKVVYLNFEGGFYGLQAKDGSQLLPMNLDSKYKINGTILKINGEKVEGMATTKQWGTPFKISEVQLIKLGVKQAPNSY